MPSNNILLAAEVASNAYEATIFPDLNINFNTIGHTSFAGGFQAIAHRTPNKNPAPTDPGQD
jgi:hypothetical protein